MSTDDNAIAAARQAVHKDLSAVAWSELGDDDAKTRGDSLAWIERAEDASVADDLRNLALLGAARRAKADGTKAQAAAIVEAKRVELNDQIMLRLERRCVAALSSFSSSPASSAAAVRDAWLEEDANARRALGPPTGSSASKISSSHLVRLMLEAMGLPRLVGASSFAGVSVDDAPGTHAERAAAAFPKGPRAAAEALSKLETSVEAWAASVRVYDDEAHATRAAARRRWLVDSDIANAIWSTGIDVHRTFTNGAVFGHAATIDAAANANARADSLAAQQRWEEQNQRTSEQKLAQMRAERGLGDGVKARRVR